MLKNVILNIINFIVLGVTMITFVKIFIELFKNLWSEILDNKLNRKIIETIAFQILLSTLLLFLDYWNSFLKQGNFLVADTFNAFLKPVGLTFKATPIQNVMFTILSILFISFLIYSFFSKGAKRILKKVNIDIDFNKRDKELLLLFDNSFKFRIRIEYLKRIILFATFLNVSIQLWVFNYVIYPNLLPKIVFVSIILSVLLTILLGIIFIQDMKEVAYLFAIQNIFEVKENSDIVDIFKVILKNGFLKLRGEEFFKELRNYVGIGVLDILPKKSLDDLEMDKIYRLEFSDDFVKKEFEKELKSRVDKNECFKNVV